MRCTSISQQPVPARAPAQRATPLGRAARRKQPYCFPLYVLGPLYVSAYGELSDAHDAGACCCSDLPLYAVVRAGGELEARNGAGEHGVR